MIKLILRKKGYILLTMMMFVTILMTAVLGIHAYIKYFAKEIWQQDVERPKGYYAALAGLRYAAILLRDPSSIPFDADHSYAVTGAELGGDFIRDVIGTEPATLDVTITQIMEGPDEGKYTLVAAYKR